MENIHAKLYVLVLNVQALQGIILARTQILFEVDFYHQAVAPTLFN